jgi:hypothetical protein
VSAIAGSEPFAGSMAKPKHADYVVTFASCNKNIFETLDAFAGEFSLPNRGLSFSGFLLKNTDFRIEQTLDSFLRAFSLPNTLT